MGQTVIQRAFARGEIAPRLGARADLALYGQGLRTCRNVLVHQEGGLSNRAGLRFVGAAASPAAGTRIVGFRGATAADSGLLEFGDRMIRVYHDGAPVRLVGVPAFDSTRHYAWGDLVTAGGTHYLCIQDTEPATLLERLAIEEADVPLWGYPISDDYPRPESVLITGHGGEGSALRCTWAPNVRAPGLGYFTHARVGNFTTYADAVPVTDAAALAPWLRLPPGTPVTQVAIYVVTADWDPTKPVNSGGKNTAAYGLTLQAAALRLGTPSMGTWFQPLKADGSGFTRADWVAVGAPSWATVQGVILQMYAPVGAAIELDIDDLALTEPHTGAPPPTPAPPDPAYWYALPGDRLEIPSPYPLGSAPRVQQDGATLVLTHAQYAPRELHFTGLTAWTLRVAPTTPPLSPPAGLTGAPGAAGTAIRRYVVTAGHRDTYEESGPSAVVTVTGAAPTAAAPDVLSWEPVVETAEYYVYLDADETGTFGYVGCSTNAVTFHYTGAVPADPESTPPQPRDLFNAAGAYPLSATAYQQRRWFAHTDDAPDLVWGSRVGLPGNFGITRPLQDDDAITARLAGNGNQPVWWLAGLKSALVLGTGGGVWTLTGTGDPATPITPSSQDARQQTFVGVSPTLAPVTVGEAVVYARGRNLGVSGVVFDAQVRGLAGLDLSATAGHLFRRPRRIVAMAYQEEPDSTIWCVRDDGVLLGLTYVPEAGVAAWHRHDTAGGQIEDVAVVAEADQDAVYVLVARSIGGVTTRSIERLELRAIRDGAEALDSFFVDAGVTYAGPPATVIAGLGHLEGEIVAVLADGGVVFDGDPADPRAAAYTVTGGQITLAAPASVVHVGLPIAAEIETLDLDVAGSSVRDQRKRIGSLTLDLERSARAFSAGPDAAHQRRYTAPAWDGSSPLWTGQAEVVMTSGFGVHGRVLIRQTDPLPLTIVAIMPRVELGG